MTIRWAVIPGFDGAYEVSTDGQIRRAKDCPISGWRKGLIKKQRVDSKGYATREERQRAMEAIIVELMRMKNDRGLLVNIPQVHELVNIYMQAEEASAK